jgi:hypothetical protein
VKQHAHAHTKTHTVHKYEAVWSDITIGRIEGWQKNELHLVISMGGKKCTADILSSVKINLPIPTSTCLLTVKFITPVQVPSFLCEP